MPIDGRGRPRGLAFITYINHDLAQVALKVSNRGIKLGQRKLRVEVFKPLETLERERGIETTANVPRQGRSSVERSRSAERGNM
jgi:RNA recognition motif-containing protein